MMESRKRPLTPTDDPTVAKKRAVVGADGSPAHANGDAPGAEPREDDSLEVNTYVFADASRVLTGICAV